MIGLKCFPFCSGKGKISFKDYKFYGFNGVGDKKQKYRIQVICNRCKSRGAPVATDWLVNPRPYITVWENIYSDNDWCNAIRKQNDLGHMLKKARDVWNRRASDGRV